MRITENMRFNAMVGNLFSNLTLNNDLTERIATQKKINRASDDPLSATKIVTLRQSRVAIEQYTKNIESSKTWLSATESTLSGASGLLDTVDKIAVGAVGGDASTLQISADNIQAIIDSMRSLANTKWGNRYLFSGSREGVEPFAAAPSPVATIDPVQAAPGNTFAGDVISSGAYTGSINSTYALKITTAGAFGVAKYRISTDGGRTWGIETPTGAGVIDLGDGVSLTFNDYGGTRPFGEGDIFYVNADAPGYYKGDNENLSVTINRNTTLQYSISGAEAFTAAGGVDVFAALEALRVAVINGDDTEISAQRANVATAKEQILLCESLSGMKANHLDVAKKNLTHFDATLNDLLSKAQDADMTELAAKLLMSETALKASYAMAAKIGESSILNYLK
ncbi:MAG: flagellin N-terminal helical domain-containing protein [Syntrophales bacterium]